jgi:AhpD family alkylhydroperoxidase
MTTNDAATHAGPAPWRYEDYAAVAPAVVGALRALSVAVDESGLDKGLTELLKVRVSQLNRCAFCLQYHLQLARKAGVDAVKLDLAAVWHDAPVFSPRERGALAWAEALTTMAHAPVSPQVQDALDAHFTRAEVAHLTAAIGAINAWNRIAGGLRFPPPLAA